MKANKKKIIVLCVMVLLLVATGVLNFYLTSKANNPSGGVDDGGQVVSTYFGSFRDERSETRQEMITYLDTIIASEASSVEAKAAAENQRLDLVNRMDKELVLENLIKAKGFDDAVVAISAGSVNVVVKNAETLTAADLASILTLVNEQTGISPNDIHVLPYNS